MKSLITGRGKTEESRNAITKRPSPPPRVSVACNQCGNGIELSKVVSVQSRTRNCSRCEREKVIRVRRLTQALHFPFQLRNEPDHSCAPFRLRLLWRAPA